MCFFFKITPKATTTAHKVIQFKKIFGPYYKKKESFLYHFWLTRLTPKALVAYFQGGPLTFPKLVACPHELSWLACGYYLTCRPIQATTDRPLVSNQGPPGQGYPMSDALNHSSTYLCKCWR